MLVGLTNNLKHNEACFSTTLIYLLYLLVTQMPGCPDLAILWWQTDRRIKPITLPLVHARGIIKSVSSKQTKKYCDHMTCRQHILNTCVPRPWAWSSFILASRLSHIPQTCLWTVLVSCPHAWPEHQTSTVSRYWVCSVKLKHINPWRMREGYGSCSVCVYRLHTSFLCLKPSVVRFLTVFRLYVLCENTLFKSFGVICWSPPRSSWRAFNGQIREWWLLFNSKGLYG